MRGTFYGWLADIICLKYCNCKGISQQLADAFKICLNQASTGPDILLFKRFHDNWRKFSHKLPENSNPLILAPADVKSFIAEQLTLTHPCDDYLELLQLSAVAVGL